MLALTPRRRYILELTGGALFVLFLCFMGWQLALVH
jgi:hypothetical protein